MPTNLKTLRSIVRTNKTDGRLLCIVAVPLHISIIQLLHFLEKYQDNIEHIQTIRENNVHDRYLTLLKMDSAESAEAVYLEFNGKAFSALEV